MTSSREIIVLVGKIFALALVLLILMSIGMRFLPAVPGAGEGAADPGAGPAAAQEAMRLLGLVLLVCLLQTAALAYPTVRSRWRGWRLVVTVFVLFFGTVTFMSQIESLVYLGRKMPPGMLSGLFLMGLFNAALFSPILVVTLGRWKGPAESAEAGSRLRLPWWAWGWKLAVGATVFLACYYLFGYYIAWQNPVLRDYYGGTDPGTFFAQMRGIVRDTPWMLPLQLGRGLLWVLLALPVIRMMKGRWWEAGLAVSLLFTMPVLYLLFPNPLMPTAVRMAHIVETAPYQFLFAWFVVWLFTRRSVEISEDGVPAGSRGEVT
jgi:hypothetical protein